MRKWLPFWVGAAGLVALVFVAVDVAREWRLQALVAAAAGAWLLMVLTLPWDLHFQARNVLHELDRSLAKGMKPDVSRDDVRRLVRRTLQVAIGLHVGTALAVGATGIWTSQPHFLWFGAVFLGTTALRPVAAWYGHARERLRRSLGEVTFPREDVMGLRGFVVALGHRADRVEKELAGTRAKADERSAKLAEEVRSLDRRLDLMARKFEETVEHLTDNKELLAGVRAFLRLVRETPV